MSSRGDLIRVTIESRLDYIDLLQALAERITRLRCSDEEVVFHVGMSTRESVANAICHGNRLDEHKQVDVEFHIHPDCLVICVDDAGDGFDPQGIPDPLAPENLLKPSGRGILFVRSFMDQVDFLRSPAGGTRLRMVKRTD